MSHRRAGALAAVLICVAVTPAVARAESLQAPPGVSPNKVLVIGTDGTRWDKLSALMAAGRAPALSRLAAEGFSTPTMLNYSPPGAYTVSQVGWTTIATGVWPAKHGVTDPSNTSPGQKTKNGYPDFLTRVEAARPALSTMLVTDWANLGQEANGGPIFATADAKLTVDSADAAAYDANDEAGSIAAAQQLRTAGPDASFVYFGVVDETGHEQGSESVAYSDAIVRTDHRIGRLLDAIDARMTLAREHWTILVVTDHGQFDPVPGMGFHGGPTDLERTSFVIGAGPGMPHRLGPADARVVDLAPTLLHQLGLPVAPPADLDGHSLVTGPPPAPPGRPTARCRRTPRTVRCSVRRGDAAPLLRRVRATAAGRRHAKRTTAGGRSVVSVVVRLPRGTKVTRVALRVTDVTGFVSRLRVRAPRRT
jgi:Type I phosphodiesterase / nucleotide pyrophosphatase